MRAWPVARSIFDAPLGEKSERADSKLDKRCLKSSLFSCFAAARAACIRLGETHHSNSHPNGRRRRRRASRALEKGDHNMGTLTLNSTRSYLVRRAHPPTNAEGLATSDKILSYASTKSHVSWKIKNCYFRIF